MNTQLALIAKIARRRASSLPAHSRFLNTHSAYVILACYCERELMSVSDAKGLLLFFIRSL